LMLLIALAIKLESRGPVIYRSKRVGTGYEVFDFFKFRTMYVDADKRLEELKHLNQYGKNGQPFLKLQRDPRVTRIGRVLRKTSLDELPQLFNVLRGDMSLVGNRPLPLYEAEQLTRDHWAQRFLAPAGLTGLWQVSKRGKKNMSAEERILLDVSYAQNFSFLQDLKIILKTIPAMIQDEEV
ncbi:MAG: sugar transferase, partial [Bacteroidetes bacterium]